MGYENYDKKVYSEVSIPSSTSSKSSSEIDALNQQLQDLITGQQGAQSELSEYQQNYQAQSNAMQTQYASSQAELMEFGVLLDEATIEVETTSNELMVAGNNIETSGINLQNADVTVETSQSNVNNATNETTVRSNEVEATSAVVETAQTAQTQAVENVENATNKLTDAISNVESKTSSLDEANSNVESKTSTLDNAVSNVEAKNSNLAQTTSNVESKTSDLSSKTAEVSSASSSLANAAASLASAQAILASTPQTITREIKDEEGNVLTITEPNSAYASAQSAYNNALIQQQQAQIAYDNALSAQEKAQAELDSAILEQETAQNELDSAISEQETAQAELDNAVAEQEHVQNELDSAISEQETAQAELDEYIATHEVTQSELETAMAAKEAAQQSYTTAIQAQEEAQNSLLDAIQTQQSARRSYNEALQNQQAAQDKYKNALVQQQNATASHQALYESITELSNDMSAKELEYLQQSETLQKAVNDYNASIAELQAEIEALEELKAQEDEEAQAQAQTSEGNSETTLNTPSIEDVMLNDIEVELNKLISEVQADENSKTGLGWAWNGLTGLFGGGTKGQLNEYDKLNQLCNELKNNPDSSKIQELYSQVFKKEPDINAIQESINLTNSVSDDGKFKLDNGLEVSQKDIADVLLQQTQSLNDNFKETVQSQGWFSKGIGWLNNNILGVGTTENMTTAQIDNYQDLTRQLSQAKDINEFASLYRSITGEELSNDSLNQLFEGNSKVEGSRASEAMMDYESTNETIKNTAIAVGTGIAVAATGPIGALAIGAGISVGVNAIDAGTQNNGKNVGENLLNYAKGDMIKDALVGAVNGLTGKLGNMAGEKLVTTLASKSGAAVEGVAANTLKSGLKTGQRLLTEFIDGATDAGLSSSAEYLINAAAGENGNFTNIDGKYLDENGRLAFMNNFSNNFDAKEMGEQVLMSTLMGGAMSVGMQEGMNLLGKGLSTLKDDVNNKGLDFETYSKDTTIEDYGSSSSELDFGRLKQAPEGFNSEINSKDFIEYCKKFPETKDELICSQQEFELRKAGILNNDYKYSPPEFLADEDNIRTKAYMERVDKLHKAYISGNFEEAYCPTIKPTQEALENLGVGDVFQIEGDKFISIKEANGGIRQLQISKQTYFDLFNPADDLSIIQGGIGDCYFISGVDSYYHDPTTRAAILSVFEEGDGYINVNLRANDGSIIKNTYDSSDIKAYLSETATWDRIGFEYVPVVNDGSNMIAQGPKGLQMLEDAQGYMRLAEDDWYFKQGIEYYQNQLNQNTTSLSPEDVQKAQAWIQGAEANIENIQNNASKLAETKRAGGRIPEVAFRFGLAGNEGPMSVQNINALADESNWNKYIFHAGTQGTSDDYLIDTKKGIVGGHMHELIPFRGNDGNVYVKVINPHDTEYEKILPLERLSEVFSGFFYTIKPS